MPEMKPEMNPEDVVKEFEAILRGEKAPLPTTGPTDPSEFLPHERTIARVLHDLSHMFTLSTEEMLMALKRIIFFIENYKASNDKG